MSNGKFTIRRMNREEIDLAIDWAAIEGWNPGIHDAECFYVADPNGFFLGLIDDKPIAMVSAVVYGKAYGFMGFYIVNPEYRNTRTDRSARTSKNRWPITIRCFPGYRRSPALVK